VLLDQTIFEDRRFFLCRMNARVSEPPS
jgi:hypothetical protein